MIQRTCLALILTLVTASASSVAQTDCAYCAGPVLQQGTGDGSGHPLVLLAEAGSAGEISAGADASVLVDVKLQTTEGVLEALAPVLALARRSSPMEGFGIRVLEGEEQAASFAIKHVAATVQGEQLAAATIGWAEDEEDLERLERGGVLPYLDRLVVPAPLLEEAMSWLALNSPATRIGAITQAGGDEAWYSAATLFRRGADRAWIEGSDLPRFDRLNELLTGDYSIDASTQTRAMTPQGASLPVPAIAFVRGTDLRTVAVPDPPDSAPYILVIDDATAVRPRLTSGDVTADATDTGRSGSELLVGIASTGPVALMWDRDLDLGEAVARESVEVAGSRTPSVEEIIRRHQAWARQQRALETDWIARNLTTLRFSITGGERFEASFAGDQFHRADGPTDWAWEELYINGVQWKRTGIPEIPLVQPEKVTRLPLDILLTDDYEYSLAGSRSVDGVPVWEVRFSPRAGVVSDEPLYRGTVWIDQKIFAPVRSARIQLGIEGGETLSNEETITYAAFSRSDSARVSLSDAATIDPRELIWLPAQVTAQQVLSVVGRTLPVERRSELSNVRIAPENFEVQLESKLSSDLRMVRETERGTRYLAKDAEGERYVKEETESGQYFLIGGLHHDESFEYPVVPLGGVNYFDFDLFERGLQANVFFAGVVMSASVADPSFLGSRISAGIDTFALAIPFENTMTRNGEKIEAESVMNRPLALGLRAGHPFLQFGKIDFAVGLNWQHFERADDTAEEFVIPNDTLMIVPGVDIRYERAGWALSAFGEYGHRNDWEPWGRAEEFSPDQESYTRWGATIGKSFSLPAFQRLGIEVNWLDGADLDRFSKYELGFFGAQRVRGIQSGSIRAEEALIAHLSYGFVFNEQLRLEASYDHALLSDTITGWDREPVQGVGISGQVIGPWGTLVRLDLGKSIGTNAQDGFVADVLFLKIFDPPWQRRR